MTVTALLLDPADRRARHPVAQLRQFGDDPSVATALVLTRHAYRKRADRLRDRRSSRASLCATVKRGICFFPHRALLYF